MKKFKDLGVNDTFIKALNELSIKQPTEIQEQVIPLLLNSETDLIGQAQTGTGKTAAFGLPILQNTNVDLKEIQTLVLCPTRELGQQIAKQFFKFTKYSDRIFTEAVYGGEKIDRQINSLKRTTHIVVATPGRLIDLLQRKALSLSHVKTIVLDEADEMLSMGFKDELNSILTHIPNSCKKWLFSATMPVSIRQIINQHMSIEAKKVQINTKKISNENIEHQYFVCDEKQKFNILTQFLNSKNKQRGIVFCRTKRSAKDLAEQLIAKKFTTDAIHDDLQQKERDKVMRAFKNKHLQLLVATDIAARGIDVASLSYIFHYELPESVEYYTHRSGRTARAGRRGLSIALIREFEKKKIASYEKFLGIKFQRIKY